MGPTHASTFHRLVLLRHAKAEPAGVLDDVLRPLALSGRKLSGKVGKAIRDAGLIPDLVICSAAVRTRQTWELAAARCGDVEPDVVISDELYTADTEDVLAMLGQADSRVRTILVVGHEPTMAATAAYLADVATSDPGALAQVRVGVPTATYSVLQSELPWAQWQSSMAALTYVGRPS